MKVVPAILTNSIEELKKQLDRLTADFNHFSIDIEDGKFAPAITCTIEELLLKQSAWVDESLKKCLFDFDLMVTNWDKSIEALVELNSILDIGTIFLHIQTLINKPYPIDNKYPFAIGLALDVSDDIEDLDSQYDLNTISAIQLMTIQSGLQGQDLIPKVLNKIDKLRSIGYANDIYLDGGVNEDSLQAILNLKEKADFVCVGSYLSHVKDELRSRIDYLKAIEKQTSKEEII